MKRKRSCLALIFVIAAAPLFAQSQQVESLLSKFTISGPPVCLTYSPEEQISFDAVYETDTLKVIEEDTSYFEIVDRYLSNSYTRDTAKLIENDSTGFHVLPADHYRKESTVEVYAGNLIWSTPSFYGVTVEVIYTTGYSIPSSEKHFCTIDRKGKLLSDVVVASFIFSGTGTGTSGAKVPFFQLLQGCIESDRTIRTEGSAVSMYRILENGKIVRQE